MSVSRPVFLFAFANDSQGSLRLGEEQNKIWHELADLEQRGIIDYKSLGYATLPVIYRELNRYPQRVALFHYGGHSSKEGVNLRGNSEKAAQLATILGQQRHMQLVFLNGCDNFSEVEALFSEGVPVVIATTAEVGDKRAIELSLQFYQGLAAGFTVYEAFEGARSYMLNTYNDLEIRSRVLYKEEKNPENFAWGLYYQDESGLNWRIPGVGKQRGLRRNRLITILSILLIMLSGFIVPWKNVLIPQTGSTTLPHLPVNSTDSTTPDGSISAQDELKNEKIATNLPIEMGGAVIDAITGNPIIGAVVSSHGVNTVTVENGKFSYHLTEYPPKSEVKISIMAAGYYEYSDRYYNYPKNDIKITLTPKY